MGPGARGWRVCACRAPPAAPPPHTHTTAAPPAHPGCPNASLLPLLLLLQVAVALNRTIIMPKLISLCDRYWGPLEFGQVPGAFKTRLPFVVRGSGGGGSGEQGWWALGGRAGAARATCYSCTRARRTHSRTHSRTRVPMDHTHPTPPHTHSCTHSRTHALAQVPMDHILEPFNFNDKPGEFGPAIDFREYSFMANPRTPDSVKVCAWVGARGRGCALGAAAGAPTTSRRARAPALAPSPQPLSPAPRPLARPPRPPPAPPPPARALSLRG